MYRLRSKVELEDVSDRFAVAAALGEGVASRFELPDRPGACRPLGDGLALVDPRLTRLGVRVLGPPERLERVARGPRPRAARA